MEILDVKWFCGRTNVGIVMVNDEYDGIKYYIASVDGINEEIDKKFIADWGSTFPKDAGDQLFHRSQQTVSLGELAILASSDTIHPQFKKSRGNLKCQMSPETVSEIQRIPIREIIKRYCVYVQLDY